MNDTPITPEQPEKTCFEQIFGDKYTPLTGKGKYELLHTQTLKEAVAAAPALAADCIAALVWRADIHHNDRMALEDKIARLETELAALQKPKISAVVVLAQAKKKGFVAVCQREDRIWLERYNDLSPRSEYAVCWPIDSSGAIEFTEQCLQKGMQVDLETSLFF